MLPQTSSFRRGRCRDLLFRLEVALPMVLQRRDILVAQHRRHPYVRVRDGRDADFLQLGLRLEVLAQSVKGLRKTAPLPGGPSLGADEESVLDGVARDARLPRGRARAG